MDGKRFAIIDFPEPWRTYHNQVVSASRSHFERSFHVLLTANIGIIVFTMCLVFVEFLAGVNNGRREDCFCRS